ncbi:Vacuolar protein sorting-associated protein 41, partial [Coemansia sp. S85]
HIRSGVLVRKHLFERAGKKASGRAWRTCYVSVDRGTVAMYKMDGRQGAHPDGRELTDTSLQLGSVSLRHTMTHMLPSPGYSRSRPHVFALQLPSGGVYLFQTASEVELRDWVAACNYWAARESKAPYMIGGVYNMEYGWDNTGDYALRFDEREAREDRAERLTPAEQVAEDRRVLEERDASKGASILEWTPPNNPMQRSDLDEAAQLKSLLHHITYLEEELVAHKKVQGSIEERFYPRTHQFQRGFSNWERKAQYILQELIKYQSYADVLQKALQQMQDEIQPIPEEPPAEPCASPVLRGASTPLSPTGLSASRASLPQAVTGRRTLDLNGNPTPSKSLPIKELLAPASEKARNRASVISPNSVSSSSNTVNSAGTVEKQRVSVEHHQSPGKLEATQLSRQQEVDRVLAQSILDPFSILGVPHTCTPSDIKLAYRSKSRLIHPDKTAHARARDAFERLKRAETELMDDERRKAILAMMEEARRELAAEWKLERGDEFERAVVEKYKAIMVDIEWRKRQRLKQELAREGAASAREEEMAGERRKRKEADKAWEDSHTASLASNGASDLGSAGAPKASGEFEDDSEDEDEPALRYKRLGGSVPGLFEKDTASTLRACERFLVLGTHWGNVIVIDIEGNLIKQWRAHSATVNSVSVDVDSEYVASAGDDGRVVVHGLYNDDITIVDYSRPVKAVAIDPMFSRRRRFVCGGTGGQVIMYEKKWYAKGDTILFTSAGPILSIQWMDSLVAWACDEGVQVYDVGRAMRITQIARPEGSPRADLFTCRLQWRDSRTLDIGWADFVQVVVLKERAPDALGPLLYAEISVLFRTDFVVCGLALYRSQFLVLTYGDHGTVDQGRVDSDGWQERNRNAQPPELRVISRNIEEMSSDALPLDGYSLLQPNDYMLAYWPPAKAGEDPDAWFILSPKQLVAVRPRGLADHVQWLTERENYQQALSDIEDAYAERGPWAMYRDQVKEAEYRAIGQDYAQLLMDAGEWAEAAQICLRVLPRSGDADSVAAWETWIFAFAEANALQLVAGHIPTVGLSSTVYEMVLAFLLTSDIAQFKELVFAWPPGLFNAFSVALAVEDQLEKAVAAGDRGALQETLAFLYDRLNQPAKSLKYHLELFTPGVLDRIGRENLFDAVRDKAELVMRYDDHELGGERPLRDRCEAKGVLLLTDNTDAIPCASV